MTYSDPAIQSAYQIAWMRERRNAWFAENGPCVDCSTWNNLQLDHVDAKMKVSHNVWGWSEGRRAKELIKCVVRCAPCHRLKTYVSNEYVRGADVGSAKLTDAHVREIRSRATEDRNALAIEFNVSVSTIWRVITRKTWRHI